MILAFWIWFFHQKTIFALWISCFLGNIAKLQQALPKLEAPVRIRFSTCHMLFLGRVFSCPLIFSACLLVFVSGFVCCSCSLFAVLVLCSSRNTTSTMGKNTCKDCQKRLVVLTYIGGLSFLFLPYRFGGLGERGGMVLLHVYDPPFFHNRIYCRTPPFNEKDISLCNI